MPLVLNNNLIANNQLAFIENPNPGKFPTGQNGEKFDARAVTGKQALNNEFQSTPIKKDVGIIWYHGQGSAHVGIIHEDNHIEYAWSIRTIGGKISKAIKQVKNPLENKRWYHSVTVQYFKITLAQKQKLEGILRDNLACSTCAHGVSRILDKGLNIKIPFPINQSPGNLLIYLQELQKKGVKELTVQKNYGQRGKLDPAARQSEEVFDARMESLMGIFVTTISAMVIFCAAEWLCSFLPLEPNDNSCKQ